MVTGVVVREEYVTTLRDAIAFAGGGELTEEDITNEPDALNGPVTLVENPFLGVAGNETRSRAFVLLGHPGIGAQ